MEQVRNGKFGFGPVSSANIEILQSLISHVINIIVLILILMLLTTQYDKTKLTGEKYI